MRLRNLLVSACLGVALVSLLANCGPAPGVVELNNRIKATKELHQSGEIEAALHSLLTLAQKPEDLDNRDIYTNRVPDILCSLPIFSQRELSPSEITFDYVVDEQKEKWGVLIWHEGGPIHEGLFYCPFDGGKELAKSLHGGDVLIVPWTNGIYFYGLCL